MDGLLKAAFRIDSPQSTNKPHDQLLIGLDFEDEVFLWEVEEVNFHNEVDDDYESTNTKHEEAKYKKLMEASNRGLYET